MGLLDTAAGLFDGITGSGGDSSASSLWGAGLASLATGNLLPIGAAVVSRLLPSSQQAAPVDWCTYRANPLQIQRTGVGPLANFWRMAAGSPQPFSLGTSAFTFVTEEGAINNFAHVSSSPSAHCEENPNSTSIAARYPFNEFLALVRSKKLPERIWVYLSGDPRNVATMESVVWASWQILTDNEAWERYKLEVYPAIVQLLATRPSAEELAGLESFYSGRVVDGAWRWGDEVFGDRKIEEWPRWIPLDSSAAALRALYSVAWFDAGLSDVGLVYVATFDPVTGIAPEGTTFDALSPEQQQQYKAQALVIGAAKAKGDALQFDAVVQRVEALPGGNVTTADVTAAIHRLATYANTLQAQGVSSLQARSAALQQTKHSRGWLWVLGGAAVLGGMIWWRRRKKKRKRKRK